MNLDFGDLILLLILLAPVLSRLFRKKPGPGPSPAPPGGRTAPEASSEESPLAEALRQIREALEEPEPAAPTAPPKPLADRPRPLPPKPTSRPVQARPARENGFHGAFEHDEHGFGRSNPLSEEIFEQRGPRTFKSASTKPIGLKPLKEVDLSTPLEVKKVGPSARTDYARLLQDETRVREAFVLKEVLDPPRSLRRRS